MINLIMFMILIMIISNILMLLNLFLSKKKINDREKNSPFECGFDPYNIARLPFSIQFYLISIIYLIFDIELAILIPSIFNFQNSKMNLWMIMFLLFMMIIFWGTILEWFEKSLNWII